MSSSSVCASCSSSKTRSTGSRRSRSRSPAATHDFARAFQADQLAAVSQRLPRIHFPSHAGRPDADRPAGAGRSLRGQEQHRALGTHRRQATGVAAGTPGSFPTRRSSAGPRNVRIRRRFRCNWRSGASSSTAPLRVRTMLDPFLGIGNSAVAAQRCGVQHFIGFEIDRDISHRSEAALSRR